MLCHRRIHGKETWAAAEAARLCLRTVVIGWLFLAVPVMGMFTLKFCDGIEKCLYYVSTE